MGIKAKLKLYCHLKARKCFTKYLNDSLEAYLNKKQSLFLQLILPSLSLHTPFNLMVKKEFYIYF